MLPLISMRTGKEVSAGEEGGLEMDRRPEIFACQLGQCV